MPEGVLQQLFFYLYDISPAPRPKDPEGQGQGAEEGGGDADAAGQGAFVSHLFGHDVARRGGHTAQHDHQRHELLVHKAQPHRHGQEDGRQEDELDDRCNGRGLEVAQRCAALEARTDGKQGQRAGHTSQAGERLVGHGGHGQAEQAPHKARRDAQQDGVGHDALEALDQLLSHAAPGVLRRTFQREDDDRKDVVQRHTAQDHQAGQAGGAVDVLDEGRTEDGRRRAIARLHELPHNVLVLQKEPGQPPDDQNACRGGRSAEQHIGAIEAGADVHGGKVPEQLHRQRHMKDELVGHGHEVVGEELPAVEQVAQQHEEKQRHRAVQAEDQTFQHGSHSPVAALFRRQFLLQCRFAVVEQQVLVILEVPGAAVLGDERMGGRGQRQLSNEDHHLLALGKGLLHKIEGRFQCAGCRLLCGIPLVGERLELGAQQVEGFLCAHRLGAAQFCLPLAQDGIDLEPGGQRVAAEQTRLALAPGLGVVVGHHLIEQSCRAIRDVIGQGRKALFGLPQEGIAGIGRSIGPAGRREPVVQAGQEQADKAQPLVEGRVEQAGEDGGPGLPGQDLFHAVVVAVFIVEVEVGREILRDLLMLDVLADECLVCLEAQRLVGIQQIGEVLPAAGGDELSAIHIGVDLIEVLRVKVEIAQDRAVQVGSAGVVLPDL